MDENSVNYFNAMYIRGYVPMKITLQGSERFGELKLAESFSVEEKVAFIGELILRRYKVDGFDEATTNRRFEKADSIGAAMY